MSKNPKQGLGWTPIYKGFWVNNGVKVWALLCCSFNFSIKMYHRAAKSCESIESIDNHFYRKFSSDLNKSMIYGWLNDFTNREHYAGFCILDFLNSFFFTFSMFVCILIVYFYIIYIYLLVFKNIFGISPVGTIECTDTF